VALARAAVTRPKILLADEPTGNLDGATGQAIMDLLFGLRDRHGATLVLVTHAPELAARCDRIVRLRDGRGSRPTRRGEGGRMSLPVAARIAGRELRGGLKGFRVFLACLALGVGAIAAVGIGAGEHRGGACARGRGDPGRRRAMELTYRFAEPAERAWMEGVAERCPRSSTSGRWRWWSGAHATERGLTQVKGVDGAYPLYGRWAGPGDDAGRGSVRGRRPARRGDGPGAGGPAGAGGGRRLPAGHAGLPPVGPPRARARLRGRRLQLRPADDGADGGPGRVGAAGAGDAVRDGVPAAPAGGGRPRALRAEAEARAEGARWQDRRDGAPGVSEFVDRLGAFLVLVGLAGLAVGGVGVSAAVRAYLEEKTATIATLKTLGAEGRTIFLTYFLQIGALTLLGVALGLILGAGAPIAFAPLIEARLPVPAVFTVHPGRWPRRRSTAFSRRFSSRSGRWRGPRTCGRRRCSATRRAVGRLAAPGLDRRDALVLAALVAAAAAFSGLVTLTLWSAAGIVGGLRGAGPDGRGGAAGARRLARAALRGRSTLRGWRWARSAGRGARRCRSSCRWALG
jgi:putative ABC transport system permease protein